MSMERICNIFGLSQKGEGRRKRALDSGLQNSSATRDLPPGVASTSKSVPENILAFRTMTAMLAQLPRSTQIEATDNLERMEHSSDRQETRISDAFAHLAVGEHNVAALATNHSFPNDTNLCIISCINDFSVNERLPISTPTIVSSLKPNDLGGRNVFSYMKDLELRWIKPSLQTHLWILSNVLIGEDHSLDGRSKFQSDLFMRLSRYTAAMSYKKMARRFNNKNLSKPYIESLKQVQDQDIPFMSQPRRGKADSQSERDEVDSDRRFFVISYTKHPKMLDSRIPNLIEMANNVPPEDTDLQLYTNETRIEFHHLLLELLHRYKIALDALVILDKDETAKGSDQAVKKFNKNVRNVFRNGCALLRLSRGRAFQMHLENIKSSLHDHRRSNAEAEIEKRDEELEALLQKTLLQSYVPWLRLIVGQFNAVEILVRYVTSPRFPYNSISIEILVAPSTDSALLSWSKLFDKYLPTTGSVQPMSQSAITNENLRSFLEVGITMATKAKTAIDNARNAYDGCDSTGFSEKTWQGLSQLTLSTDKVVSEKAKVILDKVRAYKQHSDNLIEITDEIKALRDSLGELSDADRFFVNLDKLTFTGTLHCEACLASLLPAFTQDIQTHDSKYKDIEILSNMQGFGRVIGVSKRCCPACAVFLRILMEDRTEKFTVRGNHGTISACSLPLWTPSNIVNSVNAAFGLQLRHDLVNLMYESRRQKAETLSLDSSEGSSWGLVPFEESLD